MKDKICLRYFLFFIGLLLNAFGVAFITKAALGTTPIAAIPATLALIMPALSMGNFTILVSMILIIFQVFLLWRKTNWLDIILQIPIAFLFGYVIDFSMWILSAFLPEAYGTKLLALLAGCLIIAFGAYFEVLADVAMLPADGFSRAIAKKTGKEFGKIKLITDSSQAAAALVLGLLFTHSLGGVREGTVIGALLIGNIVRVFGKILQLDKRLGLERV